MCYTLVYSSVLKTRETSPGPLTQMWEDCLLSEINQIHKKCCMSLKAMNHLSGHVQKPK